MMVLGCLKPCVKVGSVLASLQTHGPIGLACKSDDSTGSTLYVLCATLASIPLTQLRSSLGVMQAWTKQFWQSRRQARIQPVQKDFLHNVRVLVRALGGTTSLAVAHRAVDELPVGRVWHIRVFILLV